MSRVDFNNGLRMVLFNVPTTNSVHLTLQFNEAPPDDLVPVFSTVAIFTPEMSVADIVTELSIMLADIICSNTYAKSVRTSSVEYLPRTVDVLSEALARTSFFNVLHANDSDNT